MRREPRKDLTTASSADAAGGNGSGMQTQYEFEMHFSTPLRVAGAS